MRAGTIIELPDGRIGTICWHNLDGYGGIWGEHDFSGIEHGFSDDWPAPEFMLREPTPGLINFHGPDVEFVDSAFQILGKGENDD